MNNEIKEIYLSNLEWTKTHDNMGGVMCNFIFKDKISYEDYQKLLKNDYFVLCNKDYITNLQEKYKIMKENAEILSNGYNELEKDLEDIFYGRGQHFMNSSIVPIKYVLNKLKELKAKEMNKI